MNIILPKTRVVIHPHVGPIFFLAGPVRGGGDWQTVCCREIRKHVPSFYAAIPNHYPSSHELMLFVQSSDEPAFDRQLTWERHYLDLASVFGCIIFWLPCESKDQPRIGDDPYAMDTRGELGEWRGRLMSNPALRVVVGAETGFPGLSQIERNFSQATKTDFPIHTTLVETVRAAIAKLR